MPNAKVAAPRSAVRKPLSKPTPVKAPVPSDADGAAASPWAPVSHREQQREAKRHAVLQAAAQLFNERGFHATSLDDIAARLNVTKPTLYYYVKNKDEILLQCVRQGLDMMLAGIEASRAAGGQAIDLLAEKGDPSAFRFPVPSLHKGDHRYDVSYSGLKTAVIHHLDNYRNAEFAVTPENIAASFRKAAIDILLSRLFRVVKDTGITRVVVGGGVAANSYLRKVVGARKDIEAHFPPLNLCGDNGAMVAGIAYHYFKRGDRDGLELAPQSRIPIYKRSLKG